MRQQKKNKFFTFIFSFMPGAAEMYMGFMKQGASLMGLFFLSFLIPNFLRLHDSIMVCMVLVWFVSFFHARNLAVLQDEAFYELKDGFIWEDFAVNRNIHISNPTLRKWVAAILIVVGVVMLWQNFSSVIYNFIPDRMWDYIYPVMDKIPQIAIALVIIVIGIKLIAGKKEEMDNDGE